MDGLDYHNMGAYHKISSKIAHSNFDTSNKKDTVSDNDIGLIKTESKIKNYNSPMGRIPESTTVWDHPIMLYGWGQTETGDSSESLRQIEIKYTPDVGFCKNHVAVQAGRTLCFRLPKKDGRSAMGDSGSPIVLKGVNSHEKDSVGSLVASSSDTKYNDFYYVQGPNISYYMSWITETIKNN